MSISPGFTAAEIREFVHEYQRVPHGQKQGGGDPVSWKSPSNSQPAGTT